MEHLSDIKQELAKYADREKAAFLPKFFQAYPGGYGEGDQFLGIRIPDQRKVAKQFYRDATLEAVEKLLQEPIHEYRFTALVMLVYKFEKAKSEAEKQAIADQYLRNLDRINNWDLVDVSADKILGAYLADKDRSLLYQLAKSDHLWSQRVAMIATFYFIRQHQFDDTLEIAKLLLNHKHDLIHKAVGWMLREVGNRDLDVEVEFLKQHYRHMPRTMLRYAIEKFDPELRMRFMQGLV